MMIQKNLHLRRQKKTAARSTLKEIVRGSGYTQRFLAQAWGVGETFLSRVINGKAKSKPLTRKIKRLSVLSEGYLDGLQGLNNTR